MVNFQFSVVRYDFTALNRFETPYFLGSVFRGILGRRLKKIVCIKPFEECKNCEFKATCPYTNIFETEAMLNQPSRYVMRPPFEKRELKEGSIITVEITLLGSTAGYWEFITEALSGTHNIGKERYIRLEKIYFLHPLQNEYHPVKSFVPRFEAENMLETVTGKEQLDIKIYPTSLKLKGSYIKASQFSKELLIKAVVSRVSNLALHYGTKKDKIFIDGSKFYIPGKNLKPAPMKRWSNRKQKHMIIPAFEGSLTLKGDLSEIYPYLNLIELLNLGKSVSFGLGRIKVS
ncbi:CRISPR system precrRNA processing endoribonuclease RAMP protein Cas6 [Persephonella sp.]